MNSWLMFWFALALAGLLAVAIVRSNIRRRRTAVAARTVPPSVVRDVIQLIDEAGTEDGSRVVLLRPVPDSRSESPSKLGKQPTASEARTFLAQVMLASPPLTPAWHGRILSLYAVGDEVQALSGSAPRQEHTGGIALEPVRLPLPTSHPDDESRPWSPVFLCERVPRLRSLLAPYGASVERLLPYLLVPGIRTFEIDTHDLTLMGGEPELIQSEHDAKCPACAAPMRFLLSSGAFHEALKGDAPVVYVYGCDAHPENVRAFVDMH